MVARYGQLHDDDLPELTRARLLTHLLAEAFTRSGIDSREPERQVRDGRASSSRSTQLLT